MTPESALDILVAAVPRGYGFVSAIVKLNPGKKPADVRCINDNDDWWNDETEEAIVELAETGRRHLFRRDFGHQLEFDRSSDTREVTVYATKITTHVWLVEMFDDVIKPPTEENPAVGAVEKEKKEASEDPK